MFRGLKSKLEKSSNQSNIRASFSKSNQGDDLVGGISHQQGDETPIGGSRRSSANTSLVDLSEEPANTKAQAYFFSQSATVSSDGRYGNVDHKSPAVLNLSSFESTDDFTNDNSSSNQPKVARTANQRSDNTNNNSANVGRSRNSSVTSQMSDSYYFTPNSGFVPQSTLHLALQHGTASDVESVTSEFDDSSSVASTQAPDDDRMMDPVLREELMRFYRKMQVKNQKHTGRYSQVVAAYRELEKERDRLKEVLTKCQDKSFQRINELKEQMSLKDMALKDVEVNYTMMLQEKDEFIKVLQMQVNILKQKLDSEKLIDLGEEGTKKESKKSSKGVVDDYDHSNMAIILEENAVLKEKVSKMSGLLSNCKASILKHREEIQELQSENLKFKQKIDEDQSELDSLRSKVNEHELQQDSKNLKLMQDLSTLKAENEALMRAAEETKAESDALASKLLDVTKIKTDLEAKLEILMEENSVLRRRSEDVGGKLKSEIESEAIRKEMEIKWKQLFANILNINNSNQCGTFHDLSITRSGGSDVITDSLRSESNSWVTDTDQDESSLSESTAAVCTGEDDGDGKKWKDLERELRVILEGRLSKHNECLSILKADITYEEELKNYKSKLESIGKEKYDLRKSLSVAKMQARVFRNLCECIFKAVILKKKGAESRVAASNPALDFNSNFNNNVYDSDSVMSDAFSPLPSTIQGDDSFLSQGHNPLKVTRSMSSQEDHSDQEFSVRQSILAILKDGLGQTMKMMEERKKRKGEQFYQLLPRDELVEGNTNLNNSIFDSVGPTSENDSCLGRHPLSSTPAAIVDAIPEEDDEDWETVDEEADDSIGYIEDFDNLFLSGELLKNSSIQKLLMNWKTGCEKFAQAIPEKPQSQKISPLQNRIDVSIKSEVSCQTNSSPVISSEDFENLQSSYKNLKSKQKHLLEDYNRLQDRLASTNRLFCKFDETNESISESCKTLEFELNQKTDDMQNKEKYLENAERVNLDMQHCFDSFREDYLKLQQQLNDTTAENVRLTTEISEGNEHFQQIQRDLMTSEVTCTQLQEGLHRSQLDQNIAKQDYAELKDEHEKLIEELKACEENFKKIKDVLSKLQGEHLLMQEEHRTSIDECNQLKVVESVLRKEVDDLKILKTEFEEIHSKLLTSLDKARHEASNLSSELDEKQKINSKLIDDLKHIEDQYERLKVEKEELSKCVEKLKIELMSSKESCDAFKREVESLQERVNKEEQEKCSTDSLQSNLIKTQNELVKVKEQFDQVQIQFEFLKGNLDKSLEDNSVLEERLQAVMEDRDNIIEKCLSYESDLKDRKQIIEELKTIQSDLESKLSLSSLESHSRFEAEKSLKSNVDELEQHLKEAKTTIKDSMKDKDNEISKLKTELDDLLLKLKTFESTNSELKNKHNDLLSDIESIKAANEHDVQDSLAKHSKELQILKELLESSHVEINELKEKLIELNQKIVKQQAKDTETEKMMIGTKEELKRRGEELKLIKENFDREQNKHGKTKDELQLTLDKSKKEISISNEKANNFQMELNSLQIILDEVIKSEVSLRSEISRLQNNAGKECSRFREREGVYESRINALEIEIKRLEQLSFDSNEQLDKLKREMKEKQTLHISSEEKLKDEIVKLANDVSISLKKVDELVVELNDLDIKLKEATNSEDSFKLRIRELKESQEIKECGFVSQIDDLQDEIIRLKQLPTQNVLNVDKISEENLNNLKSLNEVRFEKEELEKSFENLKLELRVLVIERNNLKEQLKKSEESLELLEINQASEQTSFESKFADLVSERDALKMEINKIMRDHQILLEGRDDVINNLNIHRFEVNSKIEEVKKENILLQNSVDEQSVQLDKLRDEIKKLSATNSVLQQELKTSNENLQKSRNDAEQKILEMKEASDIKIKDVRFESEKIASEDRQTLEGEIAILRESSVEKNKNIKHLEEDLKTKELELTNKTTELKKKAEMKFKQLKKQKDDAVQSCENRISELKDELLRKDADLENLKQQNAEEVNKLKDLLAEEISKVSAQTNYTKELETNLADIKTSLENTKSQLNDCQSHLRDSQSRLKCDKEALKTTNKEIENLKSEIEILIEDNKLLTNKTNNTNKNLEEATSTIKMLDRELISMRTSLEQERSQSNQSAEKLDEFRKNLSELESESETVKRKNRSLKEEVRRLKTQNETSQKAAELEKEAEIERLKKEYAEEFNEKDDEHASKIKHLLKEFQVKMAEKEMEYQDQFVSSMEKFENENNLRLLDLETELRDLREELREKEEFVEERCAKVEELMIQISQLKSVEEWEELLEKNKELESQNEELQRRFDEELKDEECRRMDDVYEEVVVPNKKTQLNGSQISLISTESSIVPMEFEYLKTVLFKYMVGSADKQTLTKVICKVMKFSEVEENKLMEPWRK